MELCRKCYGDYVVTVNDCDTFQCNIFNFSLYFIVFC